MLNMIKADLFRIMRSKGIYITFIILIIMLLISTYSVTPLNIGLNFIGETTDNYGLSDEWLNKIETTKSLQETRKILIEHGNYELDVANVAHNNNLYYIFIGIVVFVICCDFANGTIKNTVSTNISKRKYYFSKLILSLGICTFILFFSSYFSYFSSLLINGKNFVSSISNITNLTLRQIPILYAIISLLVTITVFVRRTAFYNGIAIPMIMIFQLLLFGIINLFNLPDWIFNYEFEFALGKVCLNPTTTYLIQVLSFWTCIFILVTTIGYTYFKRIDI